MELKHAFVLLVDDEPMLLEIFAEWLQEERCRVLTAENGAAALQVLRSQSVDVLVSDVRMPVMDGILLLKNLISYVDLSKENAPKAILITGFTDLKPRDAYHLGVEAILQKPIDRVLFVDTVRRALRSRDEVWRDSPPPAAPPLHVALPGVSSAIERGRIAFGRGGFCLSSPSPLRDGPVRFDLEFEGENVSFAGHGLIRWAEPDECLLGIEIRHLDDACRDWAMGMLAVNAGSSYIPRAPQSVAPISKTAK